jgi:bile acid:Na+ symporter, BASS family
VAPSRALAYLGRHATLFMAGGVLLGLAVPPLAALAKPLLVPTLLIPLTLALVRLDWGAIAAWRHRAGTATLLIVWLLGVSPVVVWAAATALLPLGFPESLRQALVLMAASSPIVSSVAIALIVGLDATLAIVAVLLCTALVPLTLPPMAAAMVGVTLEIGIGTFMLRLALLVGPAFGAAWLIRRLVPSTKLAAQRELLDGLTVINLVLFGLAIMDGVTAYAIERPAYVAAALIAAYAFNLALQVAGYLAFRHLGRREALSVALVSGNCNMGLVLVALEGKASFEVTVFFALAQIPMYTLPALLTRLYRRALPATVGPLPKSR